MTSLAERSQIITLVQEAMNSGARQDRACTVINFNARTLQRWQVDQSRGDQRPCRTQTPTNKLSVRERKHVLTVANTDEFGSLPPSQIVPILADKRPAQRRHKPRALGGTAFNQLFSWNTLTCRRR